MHFLCISVIGVEMTFLCSQILFLNSTFAQVENLLP